MENVADEENVMEEISETMITSTEFDKSSGAENFKRQVVDTSDVPLYERSGDLVDAVVLLPSSCGGVARFERAQQDLSNFKKRIDANTEEQREHADLMVALQRKIEEYRRHLADIENQVITHKDDGNIFFNIKEHSEMWVPDLKAISADFEFANLLEEERRRNGELRMQLTQQQTEIQRLRQQFQMSIHDKEKTYQIRERNLAQYLGDEQQKMTSLWSELQQLRAQFADYREQTERDLEHQRNEFARVTRNVGGVVRKLSITSLGAEAGVVQYNELIQAAKRFCEQQLPPAGVSADEYNALMKKYEEAIERIVEWESREDGSGSKIPSLEAELKRTKQKLEEYQQAFRKLYDMTKEADTKSGLKKRPRSLSPGSTRLGPSEVVRNLRYVLRTRDNELQQLQRNLNNAKQQIVVLTSNYEIAEEARKRLEKELVDAKKEIISSQKSLDETTREVKRLEDRLHASESQNAFTEGVHTKLEDEIRRLKIIIEQSNVDGTRKALEEAEAQNDLIEDDYKARISELTRRMELIQEDNKRLKSDLATVKEKHRSLELEHNAVLRMINEKDIALQSMENVKDSLMKDLENQRVRFDAVTNELDNLQTNFDSNTRNTMAIEMTVKEIRQQRDNISKEKEDLSKRLVDLSRRLAIEIKKREEIERTSHQNLNEAGKLKEQLANYEKQLMSLRCSNEEQDTKLKTSVAKITTLETSLTSAQKEITKLTELNDKLQSEKQDIMNLRQKTDVELDALKDKMRKLEQEIEKLKSENSLLHEGENQIQKAYKEEVNKVHQLVLELKEAKAEIDELERKLAQINEENQLRLENALQAGSSSDRVNTYEITEITETKMKQLGDQHKLDIQRLENERDDLARRVHQLEDELIEKQHAINAQLTEISDMKSRYEADTEKLQTDFKDLIAKHQSELDDVHDQHSHEVETFRIQEDELRNKVTLLEKKLEDAQNDEKLLRKEINEWEEKYNTLNNELQVVRDQLENMRCDTEKEIQKWKTELYTVQMELKNVEATNETVRSQLVIANERANSLNKTVSDRTAKIRELNAEMRRREEELADTKATVASLETDLTDANRRLKTIEEQYATLKLDNNKILAESDTFKRQFDVLSNTKASNESEIERLKKKIGQMTAIINEHVDEHGQLRNNRDELEKICYEKTKLTDQLNETVKTLESKAERSHRELQILSDKFVVSESEKNALRTQVNKLEQELQFGRELLIRKTNEFHIALEDLAGAHRIAEDGRVNALQELETKKFETADLQSRLENAEQRLSALQQEYLNTDKEKDMLNEALHRFQCVISRAMIPEIGDAIDLPTIDIQVQKLITRIEKLERERNQYRDSLGRLQRKTSDSNMAISKHENLYKSIEERVVDIEEEKRSLETKLSSAKELLRSQEEALKQRDDERRTMKQKIITYDLESRGKDAQIRHLNELVKTLRSELESAQNDSRVLRNREEQWDTNKILLESKVRDHEAETQKMNMLIATFETERGNLNDSVKKLSAQLLDSEAKNADLKDDAERLKRDLVKAAKVETDLRRSLEEQTRIARECQHLRDQLGITKNDLSNSNCRKQQLECELSSTRSELRENKQNLRDSMNRISDLDKQLQNALSDKNRLNDRINELGKVISSEHATESELRQKLLTTNSELNTTQGEVEDLRRRIAQFDIYKHSTNEKAEEMKKIRATLSKKIEILESEKRSAEALISETALQREAIERSLTALERENKELYRNCARLQQQVAQLEMDNGSRLIALTNKQKEDYERFIQTIKAEKAQVERIVENRDRMHKTRIKQLENQLNILREQLNNERIRRRDATDRVLLSDMSKLGGTAFGSFSTGTLSAGANIYPQSTAFDYIVSSGSGFNSHFVTSPPIRSLSPIKDDCYLSSSLNTLKDPATLPPYGMVNEEIKLDKDVEIEDTDSQQEMKKTTIVVHMKGTTKEHESASE